MKKGIIFDLDGTLWDSSRQVAESWSGASLKCPDLNREITTEDVQNVMGKTMVEIADILFAEVEDPDRRGEILQFFCDVENEYIAEHGGDLFPDVVQVFQELKKDYHLFIVSNCQKGYIETFMKYYGLEQYIDDIECYGNTLNAKADNIKLVVERNELEKAVYVGDTQGDYDAAKKAELPFVHARMGYGEVNEEVPFITSLKELTGVVGNYIK